MNFLCTLSCTLYSFFRTTRQQKLAFFQDSKEFMCLYIFPKVDKLKAQQSLPGQWVDGEGLWLNSLDYLLVCYTQRSIVTVWHVVCYQSVTRNSNSSGYVYNREFITHPTPILSLTGCFFSNSCFWWWV